MNGNFRKPEFVKRYEYTYYDLETPLNAIVADNTRQTKDNYRFVVDNSSEANPIDWYNAYLEIDFQLVTLADSTVGIVGGAIDNVNKLCTTTNGHTFIKDIQVECNGISVYNNMKANESSNALTLLKYTKSYADSVGEDQFFYVDTGTGIAEARPAEDNSPYNDGFASRKRRTDAAAVSKISIPLNQYSYFAAFKNQLHPNIKTNILIKLEDDNNIIFRNAAAPNSKVILTKLRLWCPKIIFNGLGMKEYTEKYSKPKKWTYLKEHHEIIQTTAVNSYFRISTGIRRPRHVLLWVVNNAKYSNQQRNIFSFDTFAIGTANRYFTKAQLEVNNSIYYPQLEMTSDEESRLYRALLSFNSAYNDFLSGPLITRDNFKKIFGMLYFDLRNQGEDVKDSVVSLTFRYELNGAPGAGYTVNALVLHEKEIELYTASGKLLIKA